MKRVVTVKVSQEMLELMDELVRRGRYISRGELTRAALRALITRELQLQKDGE